MSLDPSKYYDVQGMLVNDPNKVFNTLPSFSKSYGPINNEPFTDPWPNPIQAIEERIKKLETDNKFLRLKILSLEGKFTQEEVSNIRKMLTSQDESSITLANTIIENA